MISSRGGVARPVTKLDTLHGEVTHRWPEILPDGRAAIFTVRSREQLSYNEADIALVEIATGARKILVEGGYHARYAPPGILVFMRDSTLAGVRFDDERLETQGTPVPLGVSVLANAPTGVAQFAIARDGTLFFAPGNGKQDGHGRPAWMGRDGRGRGIIPIPVRCENPTLSPDGKLLAFTIVDAQNDVGVFDPQASAFTRLTFDPGEDVYPIWTRDGRSIAHASSRSGHLNLYMQAADGNGQAWRLTESAYDQAPCDWDSAGRILLYCEEHPEARSDIWTHALHTGVSQPLLRTRANEREARLAANGRWLAYESNESGLDEVYVASFPSGEGRWQISHGGGPHPRWADRGNELYYVNANSEVVAVRVREGTGFATAGEVALFAVPLAFQYDTAPDGGLVALTADRSADRLIVATGWSTKVAKAMGWR